MKETGYNICGHPQIDQISKAHVRLPLLIRINRYPHATFRLLRFLFRSHGLALFFPHNIILYPNL